MTQTTNQTAPVMSWVVPVYNRHQRIREILPSLLEQDTSLPFEVILVDDGSKDNSCEGLEEIDARIRVIRQTNQGAAAARHNGVCQAKSSIVVFQDSDDIASPDRLSLTYQAFQQYPQAVGVIGVTRNPDKADWKMPLWANTLDGHCHLIDAPEEHFFKHSHPIAGAMNIALRKEAALYACADISHYKAANDYILQFKAALKGSFAAINAVTCEYHLGEGITSNFGLYRQESYGLIALEECFKTLGSPKKHHDEVQQRVENEAPRVILALVRNQQWAMARRIFAILVRYARWHKVPRRFWWAVQKNYYQ